MTTQKSVRASKVEGYLLELEWALAGADPQERAETLASVREHLDFALPQDAPAEQVEAVIAGLGPASAIAGAASPGTSGIENPVFQETDWTAAMILGGGILSVLLLPLLPVALGLAIVTLVAGIIKIRAKKGKVGFAKVGVALSSLVLVVCLTMAAGLVAWTTATTVETGHGEVAYEVD